MLEVLNGTFRHDLNVTAGRKSPFSYRKEDVEEWLSMAMVEVSQRELV